MKRSLYLLVCALLIGATLQSVEVFAQAKKTTVQPSIYKIQVGAYREMDFAKQLAGLDTIGTLYFEAGDDSIYRLVMGYYTSADEAKAVLEEVRTAGIEAAFLLKQAPTVQRGIEAEKVWAGQATWSNNLRIYSTTTTPSTTNETTVIESSNVGVAPSLLLYAIDLGAINDVGNIKLGSLKGVGTLYQHNDHLYVGNFDDPNAAAENLQLMQGKGFSQARITTVTLEPAGTESLPSPTSKLPVPNQRAPEATYKSTAKSPAATTTVQTATTYSQPTNTTIYATDIAAPPTARLSAEAQANFKAMNELFTDLQFDLFKVDSYDASLVNATGNYTEADLMRNHQLRGMDMSSSLCNQLNFSENSGNQCHALYKFKMDDQHDGYLVRRSGGTLQENAIYLSIFDKTQQRFMKPQLLSQVTPSGVIQSWLMDVNNDSRIDIITHRLEQKNMPDKEPENINQISSMVWMDNQFINARIENEDHLRGQLNCQ